MLGEIAKEDFIKDSDNGKHSANAVRGYTKH